MPILKLLLDHGAVADRLTFITMLEDAAGEGHLAIAKLLIENGCGLGVIDPAEYHDALCGAIEAGSTGVVQFLLEKGGLSRDAARHTAAKSVVHARSGCLHTRPRDR